MNLKQRAQAWWRRTLPWTASSIHDLDFRIRRPLWPPFYATTFSRPRFKVRMVNKGEDLEQVSLSVYVAPYDGPLGSVGSVEGWNDFLHITRNQWKSGQKWKLRIKITSNAFPRPGTYAGRFVVTNWVRQTEADVAKFNNAIRRMMNREAPADEILKEFQGPEWGGQMSIGSSSSGEVRRGVEIYDAKLVQYIHVEAVGTVLTFWSVIATLMTAAAALVTALVK